MRRKRIRLLMVMDSLAVGGTETYVLSLVKAFPSLGDESAQYRSANYVQLLAGFEATINFKLHANLLSAAANVPFVCIGYRFKSFDLMHGLDLADWIAASDDPRLAEKLTEKAQAAAASREIMINKLEKSRQTAYQSLVTPFRERLF